MRKSYIVPLLVFFLAALPVLSGLSPAFVDLQQDEYTFAWSAARVLRGDLIYQDFFIHRPPLGIYALAGAFSLLGTSLASLRFVHLVVVMFTATIVYGLARSYKISHIEAATVGLLVPWALHNFWPVPSGHWEALLPALAAILLLEYALSKPKAPGVTPRPARIELVGAGILAGVTGLMLQVYGVIVCTLVIGRMMSQKPMGRGDLLLVVAAIAIPVLLTLAALQFAGLLEDAVNNTLIWPAKYYSQAGGFNGLSWTAFWSAELDNLAAGGPLTYILHLLVLSLLIGAIVGIMGAALFCRMPADLARLVGLAVILLLYFRGRSDWVHAVLLLPFVLVLLWDSLFRDRSWPLAALIYRVWVYVVFSIAVLMWTSNWLSYPPSLQAFEADALAEKVVKSVQTIMPERVRSAPMASFPSGSRFYFFLPAENFSKVKPPAVDWVTPPSYRYTPDRDYRLLAEWLTTNRVAVVYLQDSLAPRFLLEPSPLQVVLVRDFIIAVITDTSLLLIRRDL